MISEVEFKELSDGVKALLHGQELLHVKLFGTETGDDTKHGRLPIIEWKLEEHERKISTLEGLAWKATGICAAIIGVFEAAIHGFITFILPAKK